MIFRNWLNILSLIHRTNIMLAYRRPYVEAAHVIYMAPPRGILPTLKNCKSALSNLCVYGWHIPEVSKTQLLTVLHRRLNKTTWCDPSSDRVSWWRHGHGRDGAHRHLAFHQKLRRQAPTLIPPHTDLVLQLFSAAKIVSHILKLCRQNVEIV